MESNDLWLAGDCCNALHVESSQCVDADSVESGPDTPSIKGIKCRYIEDLYIFQSALSSLEEDAFSDPSLPILGILVGKYSSDGLQATIHYSQRLSRDSPSLLQRRRIVPSEFLLAENRRIQEAGDFIVGYYFSKIQDCYCTYNVDHYAVLRILESIGCRRPIVISLQSVPVGSIAENNEAGCRLDFYSVRCAEGKGLFVPITYRIIESSYLGEQEIKRLTHSNLIDVEEAESLLQNHNDPLSYDSFLNQVIARVERRKNILENNIRSRIFAQITNLKGMIRERIEELELLWALKNIDSETSSSSSSSSLLSSSLPASVNNKTKADFFINQLISKELPSVYDDTLKKFPIQENISFHENPSILAKSVRARRGRVAINQTPLPAKSNTSKKKIISLESEKVKLGTNATTTTLKTPQLRPILPAMSSMAASTSSNSITTTSVRTSSSEFSDPGRQSQPSPELQGSLLLSKSMERDNNQNNDSKLQADETFCVKGGNPSTPKKAVVSSLQSSSTSTVISINL